MPKQSPSNLPVPAMVTALGNIVGKHTRGISAVTGGLGGGIAILDNLFGIQLVPYGTALVDFLTSNGAVALLLLIVLISQTLLYQRVEWIVKQLEPDEDEGSEKNDQKSDEEVEVVTDGGSSKLPPRDNKGQFTTKNSGGSNLLLLLLAAVTGYLMGAETGVVDPIAGALIAIAVISLLQSQEG